MRGRRRPTAHSLASRPTQGFLRSRSASTGMVDYQTIAVAVEGPVATVKMNRPEALNALNIEQQRSLQQIISDSVVRR